MEVAIVTKRVLAEPHLEIDINLESGRAYIKLTYTCQKCAGYGCHSRNCDDNVVLEAENVVSTVGENIKPLLEKVFGQILNTNS